MPITHPNLHLTKLVGAIPAWSGEIKPDDLQPICQSVQDGGGRLVALWGTDARELGNGFTLHIALVNETGLICLSVPLPDGQPGYPDISQIFPVANRMQRAAYDLLGIYAHEGQDHRKWLRHGAWHGGSFPLRKDFDAILSRTDEPDAYPFVQVEGQGVHEIAVGPVHAGTIEPGHFRFSVVGEKTLRLEERLGYAHKGIEKLFERMPASDGYRLAGRISGDSTVAFAWAYCMALESAWGWQVPPRALWLRALMLERERVANHLGDLGACLLYTSDAADDL